MGLMRPVAFQSHGTQGHVTQEFTGDYRAERDGYLRSDTPVHRAKRSWFLKAQKRNHLHGAIDYSTAIGTPVYAVHDGVIVDQGKYDYTGENYLTLRVKQGPIYQIVAFYTHLLHDSFRFKRGDRVKKGQIIAKTGNSGWSTGPHLHFEVRKGYRWETPNFTNTYRWLKLDPQPFINGKPLSEVV